MSNVKCGSCSKLGFDKIDDDYFCIKRSSCFEDDSETCPDYVDGCKCKTVKTIDTISVITCSGGTITSVFSFSGDDADGAEKKFTDKIISHEGDDVDSEDLSNYLDDGIYESDDGSIEIYLYWSDSAVITVEGK